MDGEGSVLKLLYYEVVNDLLLILLCLFYLFFLSGIETVMFKVIIVSDMVTVNTIQEKW